MENVSLWQKLKRDFDSGIEKIQWFSTLFHERLTSEISLFKYLNTINELEKKKEALYATIGRKVFELMSKRTVDVYSQADVRKAIKEIKSLNAQIDTIKKDAEALQ